MQPQTLRHLIVVAICCAGVATLYLLPQADRQREPVADPSAQPNRSVPITVGPVSRSARGLITSSVSPRPASTPYDPEQPIDTRAPVPPESPAPPATSPTAPSASSTSPTPDPSGASSTSTPSPSAPSTTPISSVTTSGPPTPDPSGSTASTTPPRDTEPPDQVTGVAVSDLNPTELSLSWAPAADNRGITSYVIFLNGYRVGETKATRATVPWLNDIVNEYLLTVRAIDTSGIAGPPSAGIPMTRPEPEPSASPSAGDSGPPSGPPTQPGAPESRKGTP